MPIRGRESRWRSRPTGSLGTYRANTKTLQVPARADYCDVRRRRRQGHEREPAPGHAPAMAERDGVVREQLASPSHSYAHASC